MSAVLTPDVKHVRPIMENFERQALHAASLGFFHPITNEWLSFSSKIPKDMVMMYHFVEFMVPVMNQN